MFGGRGPYTLSTEPRRKNNNNYKPKRVQKRQVEPTARRACPSARTVVRSSQMSLRGVGTWRSLTDDRLWVSSPEKGEVGEGVGRVTNGRVPFVGYS